MPDLMFGRGSYRRDNGNMPEFKLINMLLEATPANEGGVTLMSLPGVEDYATVGAGPVQGVFQKDGVFGGDVFTVSGGSLYRGTTLIGALTGSGPVRWAASSAELVVTRGAQAFSYNGINLAAITMPGGYSVNSVDYAAGLFLFAAAGGGRWYFSAVNDARTVGTTNFATAESEPDQLLDLLAIGDALFLAGTSSLEVWIKTGNAALPYEPITNRTADRGIVATVCIAEVDNALHLIGDDRVLYRMAEVPMRISDHAMEERLQASTTHQLFRFIYEGHLVLGIRLDDATYVFDYSTKQFSELTTLLQDNWLAGCATQLTGRPLFGDATTNKLYRFGGWSHGAVPVERQFNAYLPVKGGTVPLDTLEVHINAGATAIESGSGSEPMLEMRMSRDNGRTWSLWKPKSMGRMGQYRKRVRWNRLGRIDSPGALFEFRLTEAVPLRVSAVTANEPGSGRGR